MPLNGLNRSNGSGCKEEKSNGEQNIYSLRSEIKEIKERESSHKRLVMTAIIGGRFEVQRFGKRSERVRSTQQ